MNQRGISNIVTTVIVILISITAVSATWSFVIKPLVMDGIQTSPSIEVCTSHQFEVKSCQRINTSAGQEGYNIAYTLSTRSDKVESTQGLRIILDLSDGTKLAGLGDDSIAVGETKDVQFITNKVAKEVSVLGVFSLLDSSKKLSCESASFSCENERIVFTEVDPEQQILNETNQSITNQTEINNTEEIYPRCIGQISEGYDACNNLVPESTDRAYACAMHNNWNNQCNWNIEEAFCEGTMNCTNLITEESCINIAGCAWETEPRYCGDGERNVNEVCDGLDGRPGEAGFNCEQFGYESGEVVCSSDCMGWDYSNCV